MRATLFLRTVGAAVLLATFATARGADLSVRLDARQIARKHVHTDLTLAVKGGGPLTLVYPKWIPGEHGPSGPLNTLIGLSIRANGQLLTWQRDPKEMFAINLNVPAGVTRLEIALDSGLPVDSGDFTAGPTSSAQVAVISWNQFVLLPKGRDAATLSTEAALIPPADWKLTSALDLKPQADGSVQLESATLARLIDSPVQLGRFAKHIELAGSAPFPELKHTISLVADSEEAMVVPDDFAAGYGRLVAQAGLLFGTRMYRHYTWILTLSDHVAHFGLEHNESSDNRRDERTLVDPELTPWLAQLLGHEYVHSWNGKYRRPQGLLSADYQKPMDGSLLWVYEGLTEFWGDVLSTRAGLLTPAQYRDSLGYLAGWYDTEPGAQWRPLVDTAVAAQELYNSPEAFRSSRRDTDFYDGSVFLWLDVDSEIRARTQGRASLDDFMKRFYAGESGAPQVKPYIEQDVYDTLAAVAPGADWRAFIRRHLDTTNTQALFGALERSGWKLSYTPQKNSWIGYWEKRKKITVRQWSIGLNLDKDALITDVFEDRPAAKAGVGPGMTLVAVNGKRFTPEVLDAAMTEAQITHKPIELLVQSDDYFRTLPVPYFDGQRYPHVVRADGTNDTLSSVLASHR